MKSKILFLFCTAFSLNLFAQQAPTLTLSDFPYAKSDFKYDFRLTTSAVAAPKPGTNQVWNYGKELLPNVETYTYYKYSEPSIPALTHIDFGFSENVTPSLFIEYNDLLSLNTNGFQLIGRNYPSQKYGIGGLTGTATDSFKIENQTVLYTDPISAMKFPMTMGTNWTSDVSRQYSAKLTIASFGVNNATFLKRSREVRKDSVVGWGDIIVPIGTKPSAPYQSLMVHRYITVVDSIFLDGKPAPLALMQAFGLVQGNKTVETLKMFWRTNELYPAAYFRYKSNNFTKFYYFLANQHGNVLSTKDAEVQVETNIFPNPSADGRFTINFEKPSAKNWALKIYDLSGREIAVETISGEGKITHSFQLSTSKGAYFYALFNENQQFMSNGTCIFE
jgi:hypothetical protein